MIDRLLAFDTAALDAIQGLRCPFLDAVMPFISGLGDGGAVWIGLTLVLMLFRKTRKTGYMMALALVLGLLIGNLTETAYSAHTAIRCKPGRHTAHRPAERLFLPLRPYARFL